MIFPSRSDYPNNFAILDHRHPTDLRLYASLIEASASAYFESDPISRYFLIKKFYLAESLLKDRSFERILDIGTGIGFAIPYLSLLAKEVIGADRSQATIYAREMIRKRGILNASIDRHDLISLPYKDSSFDLIYSLSTLDGFNPYELQVILSSFRRILKPGGLLLAGCSTEGVVFRFLHNHLSFLFGKRLRTKQLLTTSSFLHRVFAKPSTPVEEIEKLAIDKFSFEKIQESCVSFAPLAKLYKVLLLKNTKEI
jgi:SAM-dependent methyltransferase